MPGMDFNGDGRDDILWRNINTGHSSNWLGTPSGGFIVNDAVALDPWTPGAFVASGDFNGDGRTDTLWVNSNDELFSSLTDPDGAFYFYWNAGFVAKAPANWHVLGAGDFNGDGRDDILWASGDGRISNWLSDGDGSFTINDANAMTSLLAEWPVQGIGDFNEDGRDDIVTRFADGTLNLSFGTPTGGFDHEDPFGQVSAGWQIAGIGDFNGDGNDDILWRNVNSGAVSNWLYAGGLGNQTFTINDANALAQVSMDWQIMGTGDYNGDGRSDILWRNVINGSLSDWLATPSGGWIVNDANAMAAVSNDWRIQPDPGYGLWDY